MSAGKYDLTIEQGATLAQVFTYKDPNGTAINLTGYAARCQVRRAIGSTSTLLDLTTENGGITLGGVAGTVTLNATATATALLSGNGVYDIELVSGANVYRLVEGTVFIKPNVTR